jgi:hypothetical protein
MLAVAIFVTSSERTPATWTGLRSRFASAEMWCARGVAAGRHILLWKGMIPSLIVESRAAPLDGIMDGWDLSTFVMEWEEGELSGRDLEGRGRDRTAGLSGGGGG